MAKRGEFKWSKDFIIHKVQETDEFEFVEFIKFDGVYSKIRYRHKTCGRILETDPRSIRCKYCSGNRIDKIKFNELKNEQLKYGKEYELIGELKSPPATIDIKHITCGNTFKVGINNFLHNDKDYQKCPYCRTHKLYTKELIQEKMLGYPDYELLDVQKDEFTSNPSGYSKHSIMELKHLECNKVSRISVHAFFISQQRCSHCAKNILRLKLSSRCGRLSYEAYAIKEYLDKNHIIYEQEKTFPGMKYKKKLRIDFYIPSHNIAIEYDGKQHFMPGSKHNSSIFTQELVDETILRDKIKDEYCKSNNITLIRFNYLQDLTEIYKILDTLLKSSTTIESVHDTSVE